MLGGAEGLDWGFSEVVATTGKGVIWLTLSGLAASLSGLIATGGGSLFVKTSIPSTQRRQPMHLDESITALPLFMDIACTGQTAATPGALKKPFATWRAMTVIKQRISRICMNNFNLVFLFAANSLGFGAFMGAYIAVNALCGLDIFGFGYVNIHRAV